MHGDLSKSILTVIATGLIIIASAGCNQPASPSKGESVDFSVQGTKSQSTIATERASENRGETASQPSSESPQPAAENDKTEPVQPSVKKTDKNQDSSASPAADEPSTNEPANGVITNDAQSDTSGKKQEFLTKLVAPGKPSVLKFQDLYSSVTVRGVNVSDKVKNLHNTKVEMTGYMAPPLTPNVSFFVLSKVALSVCPFCSSDADWPIDIVVVFMPDGKTITPTEHPVKVTGTLSVGSQTDKETGFVSLIRIMADKVEELK